MNAGVVRPGRGAVRAVALLALVLGAPACQERRDGDAAGGAALLVLAASDLLVAFEELVPRFEEASGERVDVVLGSTGNLASQIRGGAPADLFFAADQSFVAALVEAGRIDADAHRPYALGRLALVAAPDEAPPGDLAELANPHYRVVAVANPEHAPYGVAARQALERSGVWEAVEPRLVFGENVAHTYQFARTGNADVALVALGLVKGTRGPPVPYVLVDDSLHEPLLQAAGVLADSRRPEAARAFLAFVLSPQGREILGRHGFEPPPDAHRSRR